MSAGGKDGRGPITVVCARFGDTFDEGLAHLLGAAPDFEVVEDRLELAELEAAIARHAPQVAILGGRYLSSPLVLKRLRMGQERLGLVVLVRLLSEPYGLQLLTSGATACVPEDASSADLLTATRLAAEGTRVLVTGGDSPPANDRARTMLTQREWEVLVLIQAGNSNLQIAEALTIATETVRVHVKHIYRKLGVTRRNELVASDLAYPQTGTRLVLER